MTEQELYAVGSAVAEEYLNTFNTAELKPTDCKRFMVEFFMRGYRTAESVMYDRELNLKKDLDYQFNKMLTNNKEE